MNNIDATAVETYQMFEKGQIVTATTRDHGHLAASRVKTFTGIVETTGSGKTDSGIDYEWVWVKLAPSFKTSRHFTTYGDIISVAKQPE